MKYQSCLIIDIIYFGHSKLQFIFFTLLVPLPVVSINVPSLPIYAGSVVTLTCRVEVFTAVDTDTTATINWRRDTELLSSGNRISLLDTTPIGLSVYERQLVFSSLAWNTDDGTYTCDGQVFPQPASAFILASESQLDQIALESTG